MRYVWALLVVAVVVSSLMPGRALAPYVPSNDKLLHFTAYAALAALPVLGFRTRTHTAQALVFTLSLGILLELLQTKIPGRGFEFRDIEANLAGMATGIAVGFVLRRLWQPQE